MEGISLNIKCIFYLLMTLHAVGSSRNNQDASSTGTSTVNVTVRLMGRMNVQDNEGRIELYEDGVWSTLCPLSTSGSGIGIATVVCRTLNYPRALAFYRSSGDLFGEGEYQSAVEILNCSGHEQNLMQCYHDKRDVAATERGPCGQRGALGVTCSLDPESPLEVRLDDWRNHSEGIPQVNINDLWMDLQAKDITFVRWICHSLGYSNVHSVSAVSVTNLFPLERARFTFDRINCTYPANTVDYQSDYTSDEWQDQVLHQGNCIFEDNALTSSLQYAYGCQLPDVYLSERLNLNLMSPSYQGFVIIKLPEGTARPLCIPNDGEFPSNTFGHAVCLELGYDGALEISSKEYVGEPAEDFFTRAECPRDSLESCLLSKDIPDSICPGQKLVYLECIQDTVQNATDETDSSLNETTTTVNDKLCSSNESQCEVDSDPSISETSGAVQNTTDEIDLPMNDSTTDANGNLCSSDKSKCEADTDPSTSQTSDTMQNITDEIDLSMNDTTTTANTKLCSSDELQCEAVTDPSISETSDTMQNTTDEINLSMNDTTTTVNGNLCSSDKSQCEAVTDPSISETSNPEQNTKDEIDSSMNDTTTTVNGKLCSSEKSQCEAVTDPSTSEASDHDTDATPIIRLVGGDPTLSLDGRIEIYTEGTWRPVCSDSLDIDRIACSTLGYELLRTVINIYFDQQTKAKRSGLKVSCPVDSTHISSCSWNSSNCISTVGVTCVTEKPPLRLANGSRPYQGRLEVLVGDTWRIFCTDESSSITYVPGRHLCSELGYEDVVATYGDGTFGLDGVGFSDWFNCYSKGCFYIKDNSTRCRGGRVLGLECRTQDTQLTVKSSIYEESNILVIKLSDALRPICLLNQFTESSYSKTYYTRFAHRACQRLRFSRALMMRKVEIQHQGWTKFFTDVYCPSSGSLDKCHFFARTIKCSAVMGVTCYTGEYSTIHLQGGGGDFEGWIQLSLSQPKYTGVACGIQTDEFYHTACRNLGYQKALYGTAYGPSVSGPTEYGEVICPNAASHLSECFISGLRPEDCVKGIGSNFTAGVICDPGTSKPEALSVRLVNTSGPGSGRVEMKIFNHWASVCSTPVTQKLSFVLCLVLGYSPYNASSWSVTSENNGLPDYLVTHGKCADDAKDLSSCFFKRGLETEKQCWAHDDSIRLNLGITCNPEPLNPCNLKDALYPCDIKNGGCTPKGSEAPVCWCKEGYKLNLDGRTCDATITEVRLVNGTGQGNGKLEVYFKSSWRSVCYRYMRPANFDVICQMMGFGRLLRVTMMRVSHDAKAPEVVDLSNWQCSSSESQKSIQDCYVYAGHSYKCDVTRAIHLSCLTDGFKFRLAGTGSPNSGRLELALADEEWGVLCKEGYLVESTAESICKALGFSPSLSEYTKYKSSGLSVFASKSVQYFHWSTAFSHNNSVPNIYVIKEKDVCRSALGITCSDTSLKTRIRPNSEVSYEGTPEVFVWDNSSWAEVCIDSENEANWFCSRHGFSGAYALLSRSVTTWYRRLYYTAVAMSGSGYIVRKYSGGFSCSSSSSTLICNANQTLPIRLTNRTKPYEGRVEIQRTGGWTPVAVCRYSSWYFEYRYEQLAERFTNATCNSLGYAHVDSWSVDEYIPYGQAVFLLKECERSNIKSCWFGTSGCSYLHFYFISVICRKDSFNPCMQQGFLYPCDPMNGGCIMLPNRTHLCTCPSELVLDSDNKTCIPTPTQSSLQIVSGFLPTELQDSFDALRKAIVGDDSLSNETASESVDSSVTVARKLDSFLDDMLEANITDLLHVVQDGIELVALTMDTTLDVQSIRFGVDNESMAALPEISIPIAALLGGENGTYLAGAFAVIKFNTNGTDPVHHNISDSSQSGFLNSDVVSIKLSGVNTTYLKENVSISFPLAQPSGSGYSPHCSFLEPDVMSESTWSLRGCERKRQGDGADSDDVITCSCNHLTSFAVLMLTEIHVHESGEQHASILSILTYVGLAFSVVSLILSLMAFFISRIHSTRLFLMKNQCLVMIMAQLLFATGVEHAKEVKVVCGIVAGVTHLLFLSAFVWMLNQGLYILLQLGIRRLTQFRIKSWQYLMLGWGIPAAIVGITSAVDYGLYIEGDYCWLATVRGGIYAFIAPVIVVLLCNMGIFFYAITAFTSVKAFKNKSEKDKIRSTLRAVSVLCPTLGLTWILGLFLDVHISVQYSFIVLNSSQTKQRGIGKADVNEQWWQRKRSKMWDETFDKGVLLFIFQVLLNEEVFVGVKKRLQRHAIYPLGTKDMSVTDSKSMTNQTQSTGPAGPKASLEVSGTMNMEVISLHDNMADSSDTVKA